MPLKTKKASKAQSRLSIADQIESPRPSHLNPTTNPEFEDEDLVTYLEEASNKFPSLIGKSAFLGRVIDVETGFKGCKIWLSESSMVASSLVPGAIVSVSLVAQRAKFSNGFPLSSLGDESVRSFEVDTPDRLADEPGNYFALATIHPSVKVLKDGVRLSWNLSHTLGCPTFGRNLFVYPLQNQSNSGMIIGGKKQTVDEVDFFRTYNCKELYLEFVSSDSRQTLNNNLLSSSSFHLEKSYGENENEKVASPKTPLHQSKLSSASTRKLISPVSEESAFSSSNLKISSSDPSRIKEILEDKTAKKILETCAISWLHSRCLLRGNLVIIPVLSKLCTFCVVGATELSNDANCDMNDESHDYMHEVPELREPRNYALIISTRTRVLFHVSSSTSVPTLMPNGISTSVDHESKDLKVKGEISKLGGLSKEYSVLKDIIAAACVNTLSSFDLQTTKGVLLHGPSGTGKTSLVRLCAYDAGVNFFSLTEPEFSSQYYGESEQALKEIFESATRATPSVVFIDELDVIARARNGVEALSQRIVATLLNLMDGIGKNDGLIVIAATNRLDTIEPALRRPGRFNREIEIGVPSPEQRLDILLALLSEMEHSLLDSQVRHLAVVTHGFVGADLAALCNEAAMVCLTHIDEERCVLEVTFEDFEEARMKVRPSAMREIIIEVPKIKWEDVGGQREVKRQLMEVVEWPQKHQDVFERIGFRPPTGVLLFGPPGCSKTLMARAVASEAGLNFLAVKGPELFSKWVGESEKAVRSLFAKAGANAPSIIFFDEIDGLAIIRGEESEGVSVSDRVVTQLLTEMDGLHQRVNVTVIAATNRPDKIDPALLRPGRFDRLLYVGLPNKIDREEIFCIHLRKIPCSTDVNVGELADLTKGCTGADISFICQEAALAALEVVIKESLDLEASEVTMQQLKTATELVKLSETDFYQELPAKFQKLVVSNNT